MPNVNRVTAICMMMLVSGALYLVLPLNAVDITPPSGIRENRVSNSDRLPHSIDQPADSNAKTHSPTLGKAAQNVEQVSWLPVGQAADNTGHGHGDEVSTRLQGIALPKLDAKLRFATAGTVVEISVAEGEWVNKGDVLVALDDRVARANVDVARQAAEGTATLRQAEIAVREAASMLNRTKLALQSRAATSYEVAAKQAQYEQAVAARQLQLEQRQRAQAELAVAVAQLEQHLIRAPFAGQVVRIPAKLGNAIQPNEVAIHVSDASELEVEMHLPVDEANKLSVGATHTLFERAKSKRKVPARIEFVAPNVEPTSRTMRVRFAIENRSNSLPAGSELWMDSRG